MQRYICQLIEDLQQAKKNTVSEPDFNNMKYPEFETKMLEIEEAPSISCKKLFGVSYEELPPAEKLSEAQIIKLIEAIEETWAEFGIDVLYPDNIPLSLKYEVVRDTFLDDFHYMPGWQMTQDFCSGWCPDCKIADYCTSKDEIWEEEELEMEKSKQDNGDNSFNIKQ